MGPSDWQTASWFYLILSSDKVFPQVLFLRAVPSVTEDDHQRAWDSHSWPPYRHLPSVPGYLSCRREHRWSIVISHKHTHTQRNERNCTQYQCNDIILIFCDSKAHFKPRSSVKGTNTVLPDALMFWVWPTHHQEKNVSTRAGTRWMGAWFHQILL